MEEGHSVSSRDQFNEGQDSQVQISEESLQSEDEFVDQMVAEQRAMIDHLTDYIQLLTTTNLHSGPTNSNFMTKSKSKQATSKMSVERESPIQVEFTSVHFTLLLNKIEVYC